MTYECGDCGRQFESEIALMFCCLPRNNDDGRDDRPTIYRGLE